MIGKRLVDRALAKLAMRSESRSISRHWGSLSVPVRFFPSSADVNHTHYFKAVPIITMDYVSLDLSCALRLADVTRSRHTNRLVFSKFEAAFLGMLWTVRQDSRDLTFSPSIISLD